MARLLLATALLVMTAHPASAQSSGEDPATEDSVEQAAAPVLTGRLACIARAESRNDPNATNPRSGAMGLFQFMPSTLADDAPGQDGIVGLRPRRCHGRGRMDDLSRTDQRVVRRSDGVVLMNVQHRRSAREQYLEALLAVEAGHRRRPWPSVALLTATWMAAVGLVLGWLYLVFLVFEWAGASIARLIQNGGGL